MATQGTSEKSTIDQLIEAALCDLPQVRERYENDPEYRQVYRACMGLIAEEADDATDTRN